MYFYGVDPATKKTGVAILDEDKEIIHYEVIEGEANSPEAYHTIFMRMNELFEEYPPERVWLEDQFFKVNIDSLKKIVRVTSIVMLSTHLYDVPVELKAVGSWRKAFMGEGNGGASKRKVYDYVNEMYGDLFDSFNKYNDLTDAIGIAWGCADTINVVPEEEVVSTK